MGFEYTMLDFLVFTAFIPKIMRVKVILDIHDLMPELYMSKFGLHEDNFLIKFRFIRILSTFS